MLKYKLTDQNLQTHNGFQWVIGEEKSTSGEGGLCGPGWLHFYHHPLLAVLLNPLHANIVNPRLFESEVNGQLKEDRGLKAGCTSMVLVKEIKLPVLSVNQRVAFAILCAQSVYTNEKWNKWANNWLDNIDRTAAATANAADAAYAANADAANAAYAAYTAAAAYAAYAAYAAAANAAAAAAAAANAANAAYAAYTAAAAAYATDAADAYAAVPFLIKAAIKCLEY